MDLGSWAGSFHASIWVEERGGSGEAVGVGERGTGGWVGGGCGWVWMSTRYVGGEA